MLGLMGYDPETVDPQLTQPTVHGVRAFGRLALLEEHHIGFDVDEDVVLHRRKRMEFHSNALSFVARAAAGSIVSEKVYYSVGGGFVLNEKQAAQNGQVALVPDPTPVAYPYRSGEELLEHAQQTGLRISDIVLANELAWRAEEEVRAGLLRIWHVIRECVEAGGRASGVLPGSLKVRRRAQALREQLTSTEQ